MLPNKLRVQFLLFYVFSYFAIIRKISGANQKGVQDIHQTDVTRQIEEMFREHTYELSIKPPNRGEPVQVNVSLMIESITDISEKNMDLTFTLCLHQIWIDKRLQFTSTTDESVVMPSRLLQKIWLPDLYVVGSKSSFVHETTVDNTVLRLFGNGSVIYSIRITTTVACQMSLRNFPFDTEYCTFTLASLGHSAEEILLSWTMRKDDRIFTRPELLESMPKFLLTSYNFSSNSKYFHEVNYLQGRFVSELHVNFIFQRYLMSVFFQSYFLAMSMVILAGLGTWLDPTSVPGRVAVGVTSTLTLTTIITGLKTSLPKVSYLTAMDIYLWICFLYIFLTIVEFSILNHVMISAKKINKHHDSYFETNDTFDDKCARIREARLDQLVSIPNTCSTNKKSQSDGGNLNLFQTTEENVKKGSSSRNGKKIKRHVESISLRNKGDNTHEEAKETESKRSKFNTFDYNLIDVYFRAVYFSTFALFNGIYWAHYLYIANS